MQRRLVVLVVLSTCLLSVRLSAQEPRLRLGDPIRVTAPSVVIHGRVGILVAHDSVRLLVDSVHVPVASIVRLDAHDGRKHWWLEGLGLGLAAGTVLGILYGSDCNDATNTGVLTCGGMAAMTGIIGGLAGGFTGLFVGAAHRDGSLGGGTT